MEPAPSEIPPLIALSLEDKPDTPPPADPPADPPAGAPMEAPIVFLQTERAKALNLQGANFGLSAKVAKILLNVTDARDAIVSLYVDADDLEDAGDAAGAALLRADAADCAAFMAQTEW